MKFFLTLIYRIISLFVRQNKVLFVYSPSSDQYRNIPLIEDFLTKNISKAYLTNISTETNIFISLSKIANARVIVLDQTNWLLSRIKLLKKQEVVQVWHGGGEYKKVAFDAFRSWKDQGKEYKRVLRLHGYYSYLLCSDSKLVTRYSSMFRMPKNRILPYGSPRIDEFFTVNIHKEHIDFCKKFGLDPQFKIVLYCPTFRKNLDNSAYLSIDEILNIESQLKNIKILIHCHPTITDFYDSSRLIKDYNYCKMLAATDILISDYSSIIFDFSFFNKPIVLYVKDLNVYLEKERQLYNMPWELVDKNMVAFTTNDIISSLNYNNCSNLWSRYMSANKGHSTETISKFIMSLLNKGKL